VPREFARHQRLGHQIQRNLSELLRFESKDPRLNNVAVTTVELSRDLGVAKVFFSLVDPDGDPEDVAKGLKSAAGFLRSRLGQMIQARYVPELRFVHDDSAAHSVRISELLDDASRQD